MKRRLMLWLALVIVPGGLVALPAVHWPAIGLARGEAFYQGRPTSWWREECKRWVIVPLPGGAEIWMRRPSGSQSREKLPRTVQSRGVPFMPLLKKDPASLPVLLALLQEKDSRV